MYIYIYLYIIHTQTHTCNSGGENVGIEHVYCDIHSISLSFFVLLLHSGMEDLSAILQAEKQCLDISVAELNETVSKLNVDIDGKNAEIVRLVEMERVHKATMETLKDSVSKNHVLEDELKGMRSKYEDAQGWRVKVQAHLVQVIIQPDGPSPFSPDHPPSLFCLSMHARRIPVPAYAAISPSLYTPAVRGAKSFGYLKSRKGGAGEQRSALEANRSEHFLLGPFSYVHSCFGI